ncbi:dihydrofolate reductase [Anoxybacillus flavithermus]|uniref:Dihydrofolate reductase n=1 Tax=Anoxybacillus flavithermus TaxID=33934 RepID=A0A178TBS3_9BACL|nr:dihydrofolate reductase [Anoxybacillus flavithermus]OAO78554.1 Dihydrofolate reductase [Anoxybacillus flavithermus]
MTISLVTAIDRNNAIGYKNQLLVKLKNDMKYFKQITTSGDHNIVVMGRKTFESIGKPLPQRINIVLTKDKDFRCRGVFVYHSVEEVLKQYKYYGGSKPNLFVIGGETIYRQFMRYADRLYTTLIDHVFEKADTHFPQITSEWKLISEQYNQADENNPYDHYFRIYEKVK